MKKVFFILCIITVVSSLHAQRKATVFTTAQKTDMRFAKGADLSFAELKQPLESEPCVFVDATKTFQTMLGFGGAITDASAETFAKLPADKQAELLKAYYDQNNGIAYAIARTNMNSCDFSSGSYTYVADNDKELKTFSLAHDEQYKLPMIRKAFATANGKLSLFISPWSPPAWMKDNNNMLQGGKLKEEFKQSWANYYVKFIKELEAKGIPVWGLTVQNEPMAKQRWESCIYSAEDERDFVKQYLGPTLEKNGLKDKKLIAWDHNRDLIFQRASVLLNDAAAAKYIWGLGFHWYETWTGSKMQFDNLKRVAESFPDKQLIFTEGCQEKFDWNRLSDWSLGEKYGHSIINDFNSGTVAWTDWNILLDEKGGPNHVGNFCFAPVHADTKTGKLVYTNAYYYIGHFSKYIKPGAKRIISSCNRDKLETTAFQNPDGSIVVVVMNATDEKIDFKVWMKGQAAPTTVLPHSINTIIIE